MATSSSNQSSTNPGSAYYASSIASDPGARKRVELGLSPRRPTAKAEPLRPPKDNVFAVPPAVLPVALALIVLATAFLVMANLWDLLPSWWPASVSLAYPSQTMTLPQAIVSAPSFELIMADDFSQPETILTSGSQSGRWRIEHLPTESAYSMEVWPNRVVWSLVEMAERHPHRVQTSTVVTSHTPWGYGGLVDRYQDEDNFYLFAVDGQGRFQVQEQHSGALTTLQPWTRVDFLNTAGSTNTLAVDDDGQRLRFYGNNMLLYEIGVEDLPEGDVGLLGGAMDEGVAEIRFDWIQVYDLEAAGK